ncbi:MAG: hypothetical protein KY466_17075 [Gemmatimonadetes bacterium]|nr:hypothetical protein [Gemmatimonadota bacterium]
MTRALFPTIPCLLALLALAVPAPAQSGGDVGPREVVTPLQSDEAEPAVPAALQEVFRRLAVYWEDGNPRAIASLAKAGRVHVVVQREGVGGRLSAGQLQYVLEDLFEDAAEVVFRFPAYATYDPSSGTGYAVGERVYREGPALEARVDRVFAAARSERGRWILTELRLTVE